MSIITLNEPKDYSCGHYCRFMRGQKFVKGVLSPQIAQKLVLETLRKTCYKQPNASKEIFNRCTKSCSLKLAILELSPDQAKDLAKGMDVHKADEGKIIKLGDDAK